MLKRSQITRILIEGDRQLLKRLCALVEETAEPVVVKAPEKSLVMSKARDSVSGQPFYLGEILVTECTVALGETHGFGLLIGEDAQSAYELAVVDAAFHAGLPVTANWTSLLEQEEQRIAKRRAEEQERIMKTRVHFDTMEESYGKR
ncbi:phosphonate C-P lyase system protein PhnG [Paenibacillus thalictri]|uniref:Phosphonate C-P lyase system protein PhnG n=1 Tax=Paenibacillus thalictri TaxID=2527873 RepID=A0A4Q9DJ89_9BACL|nr:phosphonate C-P lyase system protein PhnG [Paenibacillus thalictri]TBL70523.1 phosphonate C-P lyase system protein PhnG [Paenibacillus thalictri]